MDIVQRFQKSLDKYNRAKGLIDKREYDEAEKILREALSLYPRELLMEGGPEIDEELRNSYETLFSDISVQLAVIKSKREKMPRTKPVKKPPRKAEKKPAPKSSPTRSYVSLQDIVQRNLSQKSLYPEDSPVKHTLTEDIKLPEPEPEEEIFPEKEAPPEPEPEPEPAPAPETEPEPAPAPETEPEAVSPQEPEPEEIVPEPEPEAEAPEPLPAPEPPEPEEEPVFEEEPEDETPREEPPAAPAVPEAPPAPSAHPQSAEEKLRAEIKRFEESQKQQEQDAEYAGQETVEDFGPSGEEEAAADLADDLSETIAELPDDSPGPEIEEPEPEPEAVQPEPAPAEPEPQPAGEPAEAEEPEPAASEEEILEEAEEETAEEPEIEEIEIEDAEKKKGGLFSGIRKGISSLSSALRKKDKELEEEVLDLSEEEEKQEEVQPEQPEEAAAEPAAPEQPAEAAPAPAPEPAAQEQPAASDAGEEEVLDESEAAELMGEGEGEQPAGAPAEGEEEQEALLSEEELKQEGLKTDKKKRKKKRQRRQVDLSGVTTALAAVLAICLLGYGGYMFYNAHMAATSAQAPFEKGGEAALNGNLDQAVKQLSAYEEALAGTPGAQQAAAAVAVTWAETLRKKGLPGEAVKLLAPYASKENALPEAQEQTVQALMESFSGAPADEAADRFVQAKRLLEGSNIDPGTKSVLESRLADLGYVIHSDAVRSSINAGDPSMAVPVLGGLLDMKAYLDKSEVTHVERNAEKVAGLLKKRAAEARDAGDADTAATLEAKAGELAKKIGE